jgi:hypothetical protein
VAGTAEQRGDDLRFRRAEVEAGREAAGGADARGTVGVDHGIALGLGVDVGLGGLGLRVG